MIAQMICFASAYGIVVVLANSIDGGQTGGLYSFLEENGFYVVKANASTFTTYQNSELIIILGGQNAPEGIGAFSHRILSQADEEYLISSETGRGVYSAQDVWSVGQQVIVYAGYDEQQTKTAWEENENRILDYAPKNNLRVQVTGISACTSAKFNEIYFNITNLNASQTVWETNNPDDYITVYCNRTQIKNFMLFERKAGGTSYGRNDLMHKTIEGEYRLKVACARQVGGWVDDLAECSLVTVNVTLPRDCGYCTFNPNTISPEPALAQSGGDAFISSPQEDSIVSVWSNGVGFLVNVTNNGTTDAENARLNAATSSGKRLQTNYNTFNVKSGESKEILVRVTSQQVLSNDSIILWLDGGSNITVRVDKKVQEMPPPYCSLCHRG